jgi:hypothetical protein
MYIRKALKEALWDLLLIPACLALIIAVHTTLQVACAWGETKPIIIEPRMHNPTTKGEPRHPLFKVLQTEGFICEDDESAQKFSEELFKNRSFEKVLAEFQDICVAGTFTYIDPEPVREISLPNHRAILVRLLVTLLVFPDGTEVNRSTPKEAFSVILFPKPPGVDI